MEMTPISARDVPVSSGVGANTHGRDTSSTESKEETKAKPEFELNKPEVPPDKPAETVAARLRMMDPGMDQPTATRIAKALLARPKWETPVPPPPTGEDGDTKHVDVSA